MTEENTPDAEIEDWLDALGIESLCQWDVLVFLDRHPTSLIGAEYVARLLGYADEPVVAALDALESLGLVERSRVSRSVRLYQFTVPSEPQRGGALEHLKALADHRGGRLRLAAQLRRSRRSPGGGLKPPGASPERSRGTFGRRRRGFTERKKGGKHGGKRSDPNRHPRPG